MARWDRILSRGRVEDRRGAPSALFLGGGGLGIGGIALILLVNNRPRPSHVGPEYRTPRGFGGVEFRMQTVVS